MRILHVETGRHLYGGARQVGYIVAGLQARGIDNLLAAPADSAILTALAQQCTATVPLQTRRGSGYSLYRELVEAIDRHHPDLLHIHSRRLAVDFWGGLAARKKNLPAVLSRRVDNPESTAVVRLKYRLFDHVIAISDGIRNVLLSEGLRDEKVTTVRSAIDIDEFTTHCRRSDFEQAFNLPAGSLVIAVIAQLIPRKGHRHLLHILPQLVEKYPKIRVLLFGRGPEAEALEAEVERLGLSSIVRFAGFRDDLPRWLPCIDLVVHPADMEGLGISLIQAAASGVPIVASRVGGIPEIVRDGINGRLIEPGDTTELTNALSELIDDASLRKEMGAAGRKITETEFSIEQMIDGNLAIYRRLLPDSDDQNPQPR